MSRISGDDGLVVGFGLVRGVTDDGFVGKVSGNCLEGVTTWDSLAAGFGLVGTDNSFMGGVCLEGGMISGGSVVGFGLDNGFAGVGSSN